MLLDKGITLPNISRTSLKQGAIILTCIRQEDVGTFFRELPKITLRRYNSGRLKVLMYEDYLKLVRMNLRISEPEPENITLKFDRIKEFLLQQNPTLDPESFSIVGAYARQKDTHGVTLKIRGDAGFYHAINELQFYPQYGFGVAHCTLVGEQAADNAHEEDEEMEGANDHQ